MSYIPDMFESRTREITGSGDRLWTMTLAGFYVSFRVENG